jgi:prepilin peptidase CpaA
VIHWVHKVGLAFWIQMVVLLVAACACVTDWRSRRVPNILTFGAAIAAFIVFGLLAGWTGFATSAAGWLVGCLLFLPWFLLRGMGGGDVKLLAALGAWVGPGLIVWVALYAALAGGILAVAVTLYTGYLRTMVWNVWNLLMFWRLAGIQPHPQLTLATAPGPRLPYAFPIMAGAVAALWLR